MTVKRKKRRMIISNGNIVVPNGVITQGTLVVENGVIQEISRRNFPSLTPEDVVIQAEGKWVVPGFIDVHVHGGAGFDFTDKEPEAAEQICRFHASHGTTALLPTIRTQSDELIAASLARNSDVVKQAEQKLQSGDWKGAMPLGIHLEGPFFSETYRGAQRLEFLQTPSLTKMQKWHQTADGALTMVTLAPELDGADEVIAWLIQQGTAVSAGHTGASYEDMKKAIQLGVRHMTHFYNGMRPFKHRDPGLIAAGWLEENVSLEIIFDGLHVHEAAVELLFRLKSPDKIVMITDAVRPAGLPDGTYSQQDGPDLHVKEGQVQLASGTLAGSTLTMDKAFCNMVHRLGVPIEIAARTASEAPAKLIGAWDRKGSLEQGKDADIVILSPEGQVQHTICQGHIVYERSSDPH